MTQQNHVMKMIEDDDGDQPVFIPEYVAAAAYRIGRQRAGYYPPGQYKPDCELSIINQCCLRHGITPSQEVYDEVYAELAGIDGCN